MIYIHCVIFIFLGYITNHFNDLLPVGLLAQLVERCTGIAEVRVRIPRSLTFFATAQVASLTAKIVFTFISSFRGSSI